MNALKSIVKLVAFPFVFGAGYLAFLFTGKTYHLAYASFRYLFVLTNGKINNFHSGLISLFSKPSQQEAKGIPGDLSKTAIAGIADAVRRDGFFEFDVLLPEADILKLEKFAKETPASSIDISKKGITYKNEKKLFNPENPDSPRHQFSTNDIVSNPAARRIIFDPAFRAIAADYLKCKPVLDIVTMWWSAPFEGKGASQAAQMFHFDMDRFKFIKFFFYLTDVHTDNGPHCYIRGSHKSIPAEVRKDRRMDDEELRQFYPAADFMEFTGKKGTILAVDTRGLHKGKPLVKDVRLLFQIQFSNSLFGSPYEKMTIADLSQEERKTIEDNSRTYQLVR